MRAGSGAGLAERPIGINSAISDSVAQAQDALAAMMLTDAKRKCRHCGLFYSNAHEPCAYHPGAYRPSEIRNAFSSGLSRWSCCHAFESEAPPCVHAESHEEDPATRAAQIKFDMLTLQTSTEDEAMLREAKHMEAARRRDGQLNAGAISPFGVPSQVLDPPELAAERREHAMSRKETVAMLSALVGQKNREQWAQLSESSKGESSVVPVEVTDTVSGLALRYNTTAAAIRRLNSLWNDSELAGRKFVRVPCEGCGAVGQEFKPREVTEADALRYGATLVARLRGRCPGLRSTEEAEAYLTIVDWDVDRAVKEYDQDAAWEKGGNRAARK